VCDTTRASLAHSAQAQLDLPAAERAALERDEEAIRRWKKVACLRIKKSPLREALDRLH
jgi:hypothetical protein